MCRQWHDGAMKGVNKTGYNDPPGQEDVCKLGYGTEYIAWYIQSYPFPSIVCHIKSESESESAPTVRLNALRHIDAV